MTDAKSVAGAVARYARNIQAAQLRSMGVDPSGPMQLELWSDEVREVPNDLIRCSLFTARSKVVPRASLQGATLFHTDRGITITYTGIELRAADDELVFLQLLDYCKVRPLGESLKFNLHTLCTDLDWPPNGRNYNRARECISRLKATEVKIYNSRTERGVSLSLVQEYSFVGNGLTGTSYSLSVHPNLYLLFAGRTSTRLEWAMYRGLTPIARRLFDYIASHREPFPLPLEDLHRLCGSNCEALRKWHDMVVMACQELTQSGAVARAWVADGKIHCHRSHTAVPKPPALK